VIAQIRHQIGELRIEHSELFQVGVTLVPNRIPTFLETAFVEVDIRLRRKVRGGKIEIEKEGFVRCSCPVLFQEVKRMVDNGAGTIFIFCVRYMVVYHGQRRDQRQH